MSGDKWERRYAGARELSAPAAVLADNTHLLPARGRALDIACGISGNALLFARHGLEAHAWDSSAAALEVQARIAGEQGLALHTLERDCEAHPPEPGSFDVISVCHFLHRPACAALADALRPGGVLFYQTFTRDKRGDAGPSNPEFLLAPNELLSLFAGLRLHYYREDAAQGDLDRGERSRALFIAGKHTGA